MAASWGPRVNYIATDACPWGFAGVVFESFKPATWSATPLTKNDLRKFRASIGSSKRNTIWEAPHLVPGTRVLPCVRSDLLSALRGMVRLSSKSANLNVVALELALVGFVESLVLEMPLRSTGKEAHPSGHWDVASLTRRLLGRGPARSLFSRVQPVTRPRSLHAALARVGSQPGCAAW